MNRNDLISLLIFALLASCVSGEEVAQSTNETISAVPIATLLPTYTYYPTYTKYPSATPSPTTTLTPTISEAIWKTDGPIIDAWYSINDLLIDPQSPSTLYAAIGYGVPENKSPLYKSIDGGLSWKAMSNGIQGLSVWCMAMDPVTPSTLYVGTYGHGIYKSEDGGKYWYSLKELAKANILDIVISPDNPDEIYASSSGGVTKSENGGVNWRRIETVDDFHYALQVLVIDPGTSSTLYSIRALSSETSIWKSINAGIKWELVSNTKLLGDINNIVIDTTNPNTLYISGALGIAKSINDGKDWVILQRDAQPPYSSWGLALEGNAIYVGSRGHGIMKTLNGGEEWISLGYIGSTIRKITIDPNPPNKIFVATDDGVYYQMPTSDEL